MSNYKIRVNSKAKSKEAQQLFFELGYEKGVCSTGGYPALIIATPESRFQKTPYSSRATSLNHEAHSQYKEITLPELRDLVVLKRNNVGDATHYTKGSLGDCLFKNYVGEKTYAWRKKVWQEQPTAPYLLHPISDLKPIEKPMKEYLIKSGDGKYLLTRHDSIGTVEIPEGCNIITCENRKGNLVYFHWKSLDSDEFFLKDEKIWSNNFNETLSDFVKKNEGDVKIIWSRYTHPEELPFIDDEPLQSLNDQYAEIEKVRQSAWQKQEGGSHYKNLKIQPMQYALENKLDYAQANVVKYVTRHADKNGKEDLLKAIHNLELMIEFYYGDEK